MMFVIGYAAQFVYDEGKVVVVLYHCSTYYHAFATKEFGQIIPLLINT